MNVFKKYLPYFLIIVVGSVALLDLLHQGIPITHDGKDHVARIANFYTSLAQGNIIPRWAGNLNYGYGHPILMFLYPLPSYFTSIFHLFGLSFADAYKTTIAITFICSGVSMYQWVRKFLGVEEGLVSAILYMFAPYRFIDMYVRGDIGEHVAFVFPPLVLYFLLCLKEAKVRKKQYLFTLLTGLSFAALILSHNAVSIMFVPAIIGYMIYLFFLNKKMQFLFFEMVACITGFLFSAFFWIPAFFEGKYTLRDIVTAGGLYKTRFVNLEQLLYGKWNYGGSGEFSVQIGIVQIIAFVLFPVVLYVLYKLRKKEKSLLYLYFGISLYAISSIFIMVPASDFIWERVSLLQKFQFPWRFLSVTVFSTAVMSGFLVHAFKKSTYKKVAVGIIVLFTLVVSFSYFKAKGYLIKPQSYYTGIYNSTTDTGESSPIWSTRSMEHGFTKPLEFIEGSGKISIKKRTFTDHQYMVYVASDTARLRENTLYFPGWNLYVDGNKQTIEFQDPTNRGVMTFVMTNGEHRVELLFQNTKIRIFSDVLTVVSFVIFFIWGIYEYVIDRNK